MNELSSIEETAQVLKQIVALSQLSNGQAFTARVGKNADELKKEMAKDYNEARKPMIERLRSFDQQL